MFNTYPYTDFHELNLDWILKKMQELQAQMDELIQKAIDEAKEYAKEYIDEQLGQIEHDFAVLQHNFDTLNTQYHTDFNALTHTVNTFITNTTAQINNLKQYIDDSLTAQDMKMNLLIQQNNEYLLREMETYLNQIKVINFFTGELVTVQDMFNYLAGLHLNDSIDYDTMALRAKTYSQLALLNITYTNLALHGNTLYV